MQMLSMTGYGKAEYAPDGINLTVEIKTVNNRNFDFNIKSPRVFMAIEDKIRKIVQNYITRARVDLFINFSDMRKSAVNLAVNYEKAVEYYDIAKTLSEKLNIENDCTPTYLLKCPDVVCDSSVEDVEELLPFVLDTVKSACEKLNEMRKIEGEKLTNDMLSRMDTIESLRQKIVIKAPSVALDYKEKLTNRIKEALENVNYDETRLLNEVAFYTDRVNIDEELTRLGSHINQFRKIVNGGGEGKKLDFLMQEFNRETNTICSKSNDIEVTGYALSLKNEIEKVREQVQNLE